MIKKAILSILIVIVLAVAWLLWATRVSAISGIYHADGVWGHSTLTLRADGTFTQEVQFTDYDEPPKAPYPQHTTLRKVVSGRWEMHGRDWFNQEIEIMPFTSLVKKENGRLYDAFPTSYGPVGLALGIDVDAGAGIVYWR